MASTPEGKVKRKLDKMLKEFAPEVWFFSPQSGIYGKAGIPDRVACVNGLFIGIECKADPKLKPTELQKRVAEQILNANGAWFLVNGDDAIQSLRMIIKMELLGDKARRKLNVGNRAVKGLGHEVGPAQQGAGSGS